VLCDDVRKCRMCCMMCTAWRDVCPPRRATQTIEENAKHIVSSAQPPADRHHLVSTELTFRLIACTYNLTSEVYSWSSDSSDGCVVSKLGKMQLRGISLLYAMPSYDVAHCTAVHGKQEMFQYGSLMIKTLDKL